MSMGWNSRSWPPHFSACNFPSVNVLCRVITAYLVFVCHTIFDDLFQMVACFNTVEQCSAINSLSIASALVPHNFLSLVFATSNFVLHQAACKKFFRLTWVLLLPVMPFKPTIFRYDCIFANFAKGFSWISRMGIGSTFKFWILQPYMSKLLAASIYREVFLPDIAAY